MVKLGAEGTGYSRGQLSPVRSAGERGLQTGYTRLGTGNAKLHLDLHTYIASIALPQRMMECVLTTLCQVCCAYRTQNGKSVTPSMKPRASRASNSAGIENVRLSSPSCRGAIVAAAILKGGC